MLEVRIVDPPRLVLVMEPGPWPAFWTGRLYSWIRRESGWCGWARWVTDQRREEDLVPADRLRPFDELPVQVYVGAHFGARGRWCEGRLLAWRRRPSCQWEARVGIWGDRAHDGVDWYSIDRIRPADPAASSGVRC